MRLKGQSLTPCAFYRLISYEAILARPRIFLSTYTINADATAFVNTDICAQDVVDRHQDDEFPHIAARKLTPVASLP